MDINRLAYLNSHPFSLPYSFTRRGSQNIPFLFLSHTSCQYHFYQSESSSFHPIHLGSIFTLGGIVHITRSILFCFEQHFNHVCSYLNEPKFVQSPTP